MARHEAQFIQCGCVYPLRTFKRILGWGDQSLKSARHNGLRIVYHANTAVVAGDDFHDWCMSP